MKNYDEIANDLFERREKCIAKQKARRRTVTRITTSVCSFMLVALLGIGVWQSGMFNSIIAPPPGNDVVLNSGDNNNDINISNPPQNNTDTPKDNTTNIPPQNNTDNPNNSTTNNPPQNTDNPNNTQNPNNTTQGKDPDNSQGNDNPNGVYTKRDYAYSKVKELFGHNIVECSAEGFQKYTVGTVTQKESGYKAYVDVTYVFNNGTVLIQDQDRISGRYDPNGDNKKIEYEGKTFYIPSYVSGEETIVIEYFPTQDKGLAYIATFDASVSEESICSLLLSLEIK